MGRARCRGWCTDRGERHTVGIRMGKNTRDIYKAEERKGRKDAGRVKGLGDGEHQWLGFVCFALIPVYASDISSPAMYPDLKTVEPLGSSSPHVAIPVEQATIWSFNFSNYPGASRTRGRPARRSL